MPKGKAATRRRVRLAVGLLAALLLFAAAGVGLAVRASLPPQEGVRPVAGLRAPVTIVYDNARRPYVRAADLDDVLFAEGFLHATWRLWQMELLRRAGRGRLAEFLGGDLLESDVALHRAGVPQLGTRLAANASPELREQVDRYVAGVNAGIAALGARPPEFLLLLHEPVPWQRDDVFAAGAMVAFDSANNLRSELLRFALSQALTPEELRAFVPDEAALPRFPYVMDPGRGVAALGALRGLDAAEIAGLPSVALGSNGWAVSPARSSSGHALFAFDSHDALSLPNLFYEVHLFFGDRSIRGWSAPGIPGVINGFNDRIAWGLTNIGDTQDLFLETRDPQDPRRFRGPEGWYEARTERVLIPVRGRGAPEQLEIVTTRNGPLIEDDPPLALRWTGHDPDASGLEALLAMNQARDWPTFRTAIDRHFAPTTNVTYADVEGHVAFRTIGRLPVRGTGEGLFPVRGDDPGAGWKGSVPASALPQLLDPPAGFVAAANARVSPPGSPVLVSADNAPGYRMRRIVSVLGELEGANPADMQALQMDWWNGQAALLLPALLPALGSLPDGTPASRARDLVAAWAGAPVNAPDAAAPLVFESLYLALAREVFAARLGEALYGELLKRGYVLNHALDGLLLAQPDSPWWGGARDAKIRAAFEHAVATLGAGLGADPAGWRWDARHQVSLRHELGRALPLLGRWLDRGPFAWGGGAATVGRASYRYDRPELVTHAATVRVVAEMTTPPRVAAVIPGGQAGHFASPHYADQLGPWLAGALRPLAAVPEAVAGPTLRLVPSPAP